MIIHTSSSKVWILCNREGRDVFSDEENSTESVKIAKRLMRERGDLGADKGMQLVNNRVSSDLKFKYSG